MERSRTFVASAFLLAACIASSGCKKADLCWVHSKPAGIEFSKSEVTVEQYRACVRDGVCEKPKTKDDDGDCNWGQEDRDNHPANCVNWNQWGDEKPTCEYVVMDHGCGKGSTWPVCSKKKGNSVSGLCDMAGNVWEWTSSIYKPPLVERDDLRGMRGGALYYSSPIRFTARHAQHSPFTDWHDSWGFRCARDVP